MLMEILTTLQASIECLKGFSAALKKTKDINKEFDALEFNRKIVEVEKNFLVAKEKINNLLSENQDLRKQVDLADELQFDNELKVYWRIKGSLKEGPFCAICYGDEKKSIPLNETDLQVWNCPKCQNSRESLKSILQKREALKALSRSYRS